MQRVLRVVCIVSVCGSAITAQPVVRRLPMQKTARAMASPSAYAMGERRDPKTGDVVSYDPKPRVTTVDARTGLVHLTWIGADGREKVIEYHRPDAVEAVVVGDVTKTPAGVQEYEYRLQILSTSGTNLYGFAVRTFAASANPLPVAGVFIGRMTAREFAHGTWWRYAMMPEASPLAAPGRTVVVKLPANALPGLVECRIHGGPLGMKGIGEELPQELAAKLLGYEAWPHGHTIGPDERLKALSPAQRAAKLLDWLPEFERQGWMTPERRRHYEAGARRGDVKGLASLVDADLRAQLITTEVRAIVLGLADMLGK
jgi:hypothetical protein